MFISVDATANDDDVNVMPSSGKDLICLLCYYGYATASINGER